MKAKLAAAGVALVAATPAVAKAPTAPPHTGTHNADAHTRVVGHGQIRFDGAGPELWAARFRRERAAVTTLRAQLAAKLSRLVWLVQSFECVHSYEASWSANTGNGYHGGLQFGVHEWARFGGAYAPAAEDASPSEQIAAGISYHAVSGFWPWPNTARKCGLLP